MAAVASPGTPGNATPRAGRARVRYYDYEMEYNAAAALEGPNRHAASHRSYDEYSQGSGASHEDAYDPYDHPVAYLHDSPGHLDSLEVNLLRIQFSIVHQAFTLSAPQGLFLQVCIGR